MIDTTSRELNTTPITFHQFSTSESLEFTYYKHIYIDVCDGDLAAGILLSRIVYWFGRSQRDGKIRASHLYNGKRCLIKMRSDWWNECRISDRVYDRCVKILKNKGFVNTEVHRSPYHNFETSIFHYINEEKLMDAINHMIFKDLPIKKEASALELPFGNSRITNPLNQDDETVKPSYIAKDISKGYTKSAKRICVFDSSFSTYGSHVRLKKDQYDELAKNFTETRLKELIDTVNNYCAASRPKGYSCYAAAIRNFDARQKEKPAYANKQPKQSINDKIPKSVNNDLEFRLSSGGVEIGEVVYEKILLKSLKDNNPDYAKGYKYKNTLGEWVTT